MSMQHTGALVTSGQDRESLNSLPRCLVPILLGDKFVSIALLISSISSVLLVMQARAVGSMGRQSANFCALDLHPVTIRLVNDASQELIV